MALTRRQAMMATLGTLALGGCSATGASSNGRPGPAFPSSRPTLQSGLSRPVHPRPVTHQHPPHDVTHAAPAQAPPGLTILARTRWTSATPIASRLNPMNGISKITVHHEGSGVRRFSDYRATAEHLEAVRTSHVNNNNWGDIGYHYIIDRDGRIWEGRPITKQGAHVRQNNENNLGVMVLGNFEQQDPTQKQIDTLFHAVKAFKRQHRVRSANVKSHKEINATTCPGKELQKHMGALRDFVG